MRRLFFLTLIVLGAWPSPAPGQPVCDRTAVINVSTATTTQLVALTAGQTIIVCGFVANAGAGLSVVTGTDPAANVEVSETVPANARWRLLALRVTLVTDATAANREVALQFDDGTTAYYTVSAGANQAASLTRQYSAAPAGLRGAAATGTDILIAAPSGVMLPAGHRIRTSTTNRQATDNFGAPLLLIQEATTFKFVTGTGSNCATGQVDLSGPFELEPFSSMAVSGQMPLMKAAAAGTALCITNNRATQVSGTLSYGVM